jgi:capsular polysaccharide transport system ATP-binding protein
VSVEFRNVGKRIGRGNNSRVLFDDLNMRVEPGDRVLILAPPKSGKTTLLRLLCGTDYPDRGTIERTSSVSWPLPQSDFLVTFSTIATNMRFLMRLYGVENEETLRKISDLVEISEFLNKRLADCPKFVRPRLVLALGVGLGFDICLFDDRISAVEKEFRPRALEIVKSLGRDKAIVIAASNPKDVAEICQTAFVLEEGRLTPFSDVNDAVEHYKALMVKNDDNEPEVQEAGPELADEEFVLEVGI